MKREYLIFLNLMLFIFMTSCVSSTSKKDCGKPINPNGDSELALLMREMSHHLESEKSLLIDGKIPGLYPKDFELIRTAKSSGVKGVNFDSYATIYLTALKHYHQNPSDSVNINSFNNLVQSCVNCHQDECPGPIKRIEKNYIR